MKPMTAASEVFLMSWTRKPTVGFLVQLIKNTSLAAVIGFIELTREGQLTTATTFRPFIVYLIVAAIYFALCFPLTQWSRRLERRLHVAR